MKADIPPGKYIIAVSGGVDSMVLLDVLKCNSNIELVVVHFNHGIRPDSIKDERLVERTAKNYSLPYEAGHANLGEEASEEKAREKRYAFLRSVMDKHRADGIITAHHQNDLMETAFINIIRGTGHRGLASMHSSPDIVRPLLGTPKSDLINYAKEHGVKWHEDSTNENETYLRNYIRKKIMPSLGLADQQYLVKNVEKIAENIGEKDKIIAKLSRKLANKGNIVRSKYIALPGEIRRELVMYWLRSNEFAQFDRKTVEKIDIILKTGRAGSRYPIKKKLWLVLGQKTAHFKSHP
jgi:tRNA(Ile)-lysidine synthase